MTAAVLMPVYDDGAALARTLEALRAQTADFGELTVFVVDDGSQPAVDPESMPSPADGFRVVLARHAVNLGQGAALETARQLALREPPCSAYVTMDADGQHRVEDALALARAVQGGADVAFGNRFLGESNVPTARRLLLRAARFFERELTGLRLGDAHNGLRAFSRAALERVPIRQNRMAHATEITQRVSRACFDGDRPLFIVEVPVSVRYTPESLARGQRSLGAFDILRDLLLQYFFGEPE